MKEVCSLLSFLWASASLIAVGYELCKLTYTGGAKVLQLADSRYGLRELVLVHSRDMVLVRCVESVFHCWWKLGIFATVSFFASGWFWGVFVVH